MMALESKSPIAFRVTNIAKNSTSESLITAIKARFNADEKEWQINIKSLTPDCSNGGKTQASILTFEPGPPSFLQGLDSKNPKSQRQLKVDSRHVSIDRHFEGFTQLYPTTRGKIALE